MKKQEEFVVEFQKEMQKRTKLIIEQAKKNMITEANKILFGKPDMTDWDKPKVGTTRGVRP